ncbi:MAG: hemerythrin [Desulfuromonas sp.]|nr:MAG: hemerythrin [Desulfuromonas sp.]
MVYFKWREEYETGLPQIDLQHTMIVNMINELFVALGSSAADVTAGKNLEKLVLYVEEHFAFEEAEMRQYGYPDLEPHLAEHRRLQAEVRAMYESYQSNQRISAFELIEFLKEWFQQHIAEVDGEFGKHFRKLSEEAQKSFFKE